MKRTLLFKNRNFRLISISIVTSILAILLIVGLINHTNINLNNISNILTSFPLWGLLLVLSMTLMNIAIGSYKWKLVMEHLSKNIDLMPGYFFYLANTALGAFMGLFIPVQISTVVVRSISTRVGGYGSIGKGAITSLISQFQDVLVILFFFLPGILILLFGENIALWFAFIIISFFGGFIFFKFFADPIVKRISFIHIQEKNFQLLHERVIRIIINLFKEIERKDLLDPA